jgi:tRNA (guanine-N7-)-methyltransferase
MVRLPISTRRIEREFGVPLAGNILPPDQWTQTALKKLPIDAPLQWAGLFGRSAPVVVDIGCGNGRFLIASAVWRHDYDHLGIDVLPLVLRYATRRANQRGLTNVRFAALDGVALFERIVMPGTVTEIHCYHPQPYHDPAQVQRRLITPRFLALVHRALATGGQMFLQTDNPGYWHYIETVVPRFFDFHAKARTWPDSPKGRTRREILALRRGLAVFRGWGVRREEITESDALKLAERLPPPLFDAGQPIGELDEEEQGGPCGGG